MKLRSITLENVRRFAGREARLGPFGDGLTTICAPNESGKSTFFDALHALFFASYTSTAGEVKSLQPYGGGAVRVSADVEIDGTLYRVEKSFINRKTAKVIEVESGRVIGLEGEAEEWIKSNIQSQAVGPAGLLWVRQGMAGFGPQGGSQKEKAERDRLKEARQELMSSVAGQIDTVTGGRRMDAIMRRCQAEIDKLATGGLKPKAGGPWAAQEAEVAELSGECDRLRGLVADLSEALSSKRRLLKELETLADPEEEERRAEELARAKEAVRIAAEHVGELEAAARDLRLMELEAERVEQEIARIDEARTRRARREERIGKLEDTLKDAQDELNRADEAARKAGSDLQAAISLRDDLSRRLREARRRRDRFSGLEALRGLKARRKQAEELGAALAAARKTIREAPLSEADLEEIEALERRRAGAHLRQEAGAASFRVDYDGDVRVAIDDRDIQGGEVRAILKETHVALPGIGDLVLSPAADAAAGDDPEALAREIASRLASFDLEDLSAARKAIREVHAAKSTEDTTKGSIAAIVPEGVEELRERIARLAETLGVDAEGDEVPDAPAVDEGDDPDSLEADLERAEASLEKVRATSERKAHEKGAASQAVGEARTELRVATDERDADQAPEAEEEVRAGHAADLSSRVEKITAAQNELEEKRAASPDLKLAEAHLKRLRSARDNAASEKSRIERGLHEIEGRIKARADDGVEEKLAEAEEALERASARSARYRMEVDALVELRAELERARKDARDAYFEPVKREIQPLLALLHGGASFEMDSENMLVGKIVRNGVEDEIDVLSGGAYEQIAILTRLAFARLYQQDGRHVPVILDDALVHSDDERIGAMFTLLTHIADTQQVIVFSCRSRAFSELGGVRASIEMTEVAA